MAVNDAIYELRMKAKITQEEFAHTFHVSFSNRKNRIRGDAGSDGLPDA